jgi:predicted dehydrogenase
LLQDSAAIAVGVVGLGYFGSHHARHYAAHPRARLAALVETDRERADLVAEKYEAEVFGDHMALAGKVVAASVTVPTPLHHAVARDLIDAGIHLFIEKPLAADASAAADLVERAARRGVVVQVGHVQRFSPAFKALQAEVRRPQLIECNRQAPWTKRGADVDVVLDLMIHDIDLALTLAGAPVTDVSASGVRVVTGTNDVAEARLTFANGVVATLATSRVAPASTRTLSVTEEGRRLVADLAATSLTIVTFGGGAGPELVPVVARDDLGAEIDAFLSSAAGGPAPVVDGRAGLEALRVAETILDAIVSSRGARP